MLVEPNQHPVLSPHSCPNPPTPDCQIASARLPDWTVHLPLHAWLPRSDCMDVLVSLCFSERVPTYRAIRNSRSLLTTTDTRHCSHVCYVCRTPHNACVLHCKRMFHVSKRSNAASCVNVEFCRIKPRSAPQYSRLT